MQPNLSNSRSGLPYRKIVKRYFRRIKRFYLSVSVYESVSCDLFFAFLTDGNKSKCGTLLRLTHPRQPTESPIFTAVSPAKRQVLQGKPFTLSSARPRTSPHRHMPQATPPRHAPTPPPRTPHTATRPRHTHSLSCSCAPLMHITSSPKSHVIPPGPHSSTARKPQNINDPISKHETLSRELRAKLLRLRSQGPADHTPPSPYKVARNSPRAPFINSAKTAEYQRSDFKT